MIKVTLKDGSKKEVKKGSSVFEVAKEISGRLAKEAIVGEVNGKLVDLNYILNEDVELSILTFNEEAGRETFRHSTAHIMARAVKKLYPNAKLAIGPAIENGFYYDFDVDQNLTPQDLEKIEKEMKSIIEKQEVFERFELSREEALAKMKALDEPYKVELIENLPEDAIISFYSHGEFVDLCAGPHMFNIKAIKAFKLLSATGAYWRGDENNKMLQRIYGTCFPKASMLEEHLARLEDAKKRDHNKLGRELQLFTTNEYIGQGLPLLLPKGAKIIQILQRFVEDEEERRGYELTKTPLMAKSDLYKISGHWQLYKDGMFVLGDEEVDKEVFGLRPMTCPFQIMAYKNTQKSYRDLPKRYNETSTLFRNESSGEMHGLIRVRQFTISEGHLMVTPEQLEDEFKGVVSLINYFMDVLGISNDITYQFSKWDPNKSDKYIGSPKQWEAAQDQMRTILDHLAIDYVEAEGEAAFYGPKLDIQFKNVHGKEDTIITVQIDFALAEKFDMTYIDKNGEKKYPYIIHRTSIGCYERTLAMLIEKYAGKFPAWLAPVQVKLLPIADRHLDYAYELKSKFEAKGIRVEVDARVESVGYKIREARLERNPYMIIIGDNEIENQNVSVRSRDKGELGSVDFNEFLKDLVEEIETRKILLEQ
ncbi:MAG: threonine--tRNA ligase [Clostridia bacterium]|nr:threonine--tRNA ligase [Clostridia bacterium]